MNASVFAVGALAALFAGCSPSSSASLACDPSHCAPGNDCIDDHLGAGPSCHKVCTQQAQCPSGWYCNDGQPKSWCVPATKPIAAQKGQFGGACGGGCDAADGFACYGTSPTDATAFCTLFGCENDSDCPGGWWCARVDQAPNATTTSRTFGQVERVCLPRQYCAPCAADHDCSPAADGTPQHCVADAKGGHFCAPACASDSSCAPDAICTQQWTLCTGPTPCDGGDCKAQACASDDDCPPANGTFQHCNGGECAPECGSARDCSAGQTCGPVSVCTPRAGVCAGDGTFCSPCRSDADCTDGYCLAADYSTERFCSQAAAGGSCDADAGPPFAGCPTRPPGANYRGVSCTTSSTDFAPAGQCFGYVILGTATGIQQGGAGCWTANR